MGRSIQAAAPVAEQPDETVTASAMPTMHAFSVAEQSAGFRSVSEIESVRKSGFGSGDRIDQKVW